MNNVSDYGDNYPPFFTGSERNPDNMSNGEPLYDSQETQQKATDSEVLIWDEFQLRRIIREEMNSALSGYIKGIIT